MTIAGRARSATGSIASIGLALLVLLWSCSARSGWVLDDAFIYQRFVRNAVEGAGLLFTPGEWVEGYSSPLYGVLLTLLGSLNLRGFVVARAVGVLCAVTALVIIARTKASSRFLPSLLALALALNPSFAWWATSGLETTLVAALTAIMASAVLAGKEKSVAIVGGLLAVARPEGVIFTVAGLAWFLAREPVTKPRLRQGLVSLFLSLAPWMAWESYRLWTYSAWIANSADAKLAHDAIVTTRTPTLRGVWYIASASRKLAGETLAAVLVMLALGRQQRTAEGGREARARFVFLACSILGLIFFILRVSGDWMPEARFLIPLAPMVYVMAAGSSVTCSGTRWQVPAAAAAVACAFGSARQIAELTSTRPPFELAIEVVPRPRARALLEEPKADFWAHFYARHALRFTAPGEAVLHLDVGQSSYLLADLRIIDQFGLVSRKECDFLRGRLEEGEMTRRLAADSPSVAFVLVKAGTTEPATRVAGAMASQLAQDYAIVDRHAWWGPHDLVVYVRRNVLSRPPDTARTTALVERSIGLRWNLDVLNTR